MAAKKKKMQPRTRGVFEKVPGSGEWWIRYSDADGRLRREKCGPKSLARAAYAKRKREIREGKFFPEKIHRKREMLFRDMAKLYLEEHSKVNNRSWRTDKTRSDRLIKYYGNTPYPRSPNKTWSAFGRFWLKNSPLRP